MTPETVSTLAWVILLGPFAAAVLITLFTQKQKAISALLSVGSMIVGAVCSIALLLWVIGQGPDMEPVKSSFVWAALAGIDITLRIGVQVDFISVLMSLVVTIVGSCIFVYAIGYMKGDDGWSRFFAKFAFFAFSMLGITFSTNFLQIFIFWELVGVSSYLLIGYFYQKPSAVEAGKKAFMTNRIGDFGMTIGILMVFWSVRQAFADVFPNADALDFEFLKSIWVSEEYRSMLFAAMGWKAWGGALLIFVGAMGKSAQFPLHVWLPDAMEGPTPVSALMHAATMVAAGVYMLVRIFWMFAWATQALEVVAWIGGITALMAALIAFVQTDIKKILAYSTLSQLGYMVMACGLVSAGAGMFHLTTHACFKALLFLGAGSVAHACHTYDIFEMGGLAKKMKHTTWTFWVGTLALAGIAPLAGFWSKDEILHAAHRSTAELGFNAHFLYFIAVGVAFMTAFYMGRLVFTTFYGKYRGHGEPHESPPVMWIPLAVLAHLSIVIGFIGAPFGPFKDTGLNYFLRLATPTAEGVEWGLFHHATFNMQLATTGTIMGVGGLVLSFLFYGPKPVFSAERMKERLKPLHTLLVHKFYIDEFYLFLVKRVQQGIAVVSNFVEQYIIIGIIVNGIAGGTREAGNRLRGMQTGRVHSYVTVILAGITILVFWIVVS